MPSEEWGEWSELQAEGNSYQRREDQRSELLKKKKNYYYFKIEM